MAEVEQDKLGMTEEQWQRFTECTRGYVEQDEDGIDLSLLRENLKLTPAERLAGLQQTYDFFRTVRHGRHSD
jgi:hypothetical protein